MKTQTSLEFSLYLDIVALSIEAGLDFTSALAGVVNHDPKNFIAQKFSVLLTHLREGKSRKAAIEALVAQWPHPTVENFCQTLLFGWQQGISISRILREQATAIRRDAAFQLEKEVHKKQLKLLLPLFLMIVPAVLIVLMTPLLIQLMQFSF